MVGSRGPVTEAAHQFVRTDGGEALGGPVCEDVESETGRDHLLVEVQGGLLSSGKDVAGGVLHRQAFTPGGSSPLVER